MIQSQAIRYGAVVLLLLTSPLAAQFNGVQVNVDAMGNDILGDAANEPSIAVDPHDPNRIAIGWRQFDTITSLPFRQAGVGYSTDGGLTWTAGVLDPGVFRSEPVLDFDVDGNFYYSSLTRENGVLSVDIFKSSDGGTTWSDPVFASFGGDKQWMVIDRTDGVGRGNIYQHWNALGPGLSQVPDTSFTRSVDGASSFEEPLAAPTPYSIFGTMDVGPDGTLYVGGVSQGFRGHLFAKSTNAQDPAQIPAFAPSQQVDLGGTGTAFFGVNPGGLLGQVNLATDHSGTETHGNVYMLASVNPTGPDPSNVMFVRSTDRGETWSEPIRVNDDPVDNEAFQWFGTMSVAPNGRIDAIWNDTRHDPTHSTSELYYAYSYDAGETWMGNVPLSESFDHSLGYPRFQSKLGDRYDMISHDDAAYLAYAATFTGGQDVYFLRIDAEPLPSLTSIPEPSTLALLAVSFAIVASGVARKRWLAILVLAVAAVTLTQPKPLAAQQFFIDTFEDGNLRDGSPAFWRGSGGEELDASSGDLVFTPKPDRLGIATALPFQYSDASMRAQFRISGNPFIDAGIVARFNRSDAYFGTITSGEYLQAPHSLVIWTRMGDSYEILAEAPTTIDPTRTDVTLQFDLAGDLLTLTAWTDITPKQSISYHDNRLRQGGVGLEFDDGVNEFFFGVDSQSATFRSFDARPMLLGDYNRDGQVEQGDLNLVLLNWGSGTTVPRGWELDFPAGGVDQQELNRVLLAWGNNAAVTSADALPEPSAWILLLVATLIALGAHVAPNPKNAKHDDTH